MLPNESDLRYNWVLVRLSAIDAAEMRDLVFDAWSMVVPRRLVDEQLLRSTRVENRAPGPT